MNKGLFSNLEKAILEMKPKLAASLRPGLTEAQIKAILRDAELGKNIDAVVALYSWKNGADKTKMLEPFFPENIYHFLPLDEAIAHRISMQKAIDTLVAMGSPIEMPQDTKRYLPVFSDNVTGFLAIDLEPGMNNRVMTVEFESETPFLELCDSFNSFLSETTRAIQEDEAPAFFDISSST